MSFIDRGIIPFVAGEDLEAKRQFKIKSGTTTTPPEIVYADAGEVGLGVTEYAALSGQMISGRLWDAPGTKEVEVTISSAIARGTVLYSANDGKLSDASSGSAVATSRQAAAASGDHIEVISYGIKSTTAATVSYADAGGQTDAATLEAVGAEVYTHILSAQQFIPIPLTSVREVSSNNIPNAAAIGGVLANDTTPILSFTNGDTDSALRLAWAASNSDPIVFQTPLPPNLNEAAAVVVHIRAAMAGAVDTPVVSADTYFNEGDTKVEDDSAAVTGTSYAEYTITIAAADVPAGAQTMTVELTPGAHTTNALYITAIWVEYTGLLLTS